MAKNKALVLKKEETNIIKEVGGTLFKDIDYTAMDTAIEELGNYTGELTPEERVSASSTISSFEERIVSTLSNKSNKLHYFHRLLKTEPSSDYVEVKRFLEEDAVQILLEQETFAKYLEPFFKMREEKVALEEYKNDEKPMEPFIDEDTMTPLQAAQIRSQHQIRVRKFNSAIHKKEYAVRKSFHIFKKQLNNDTNYKHFLDALKLQTDDANEATGMVREKCSYAKMNVLIASADVRRILRDLHEFAKTVK